MIELFIKDKKICLKFPYEEHAVLLAKSIPTARWNKRERQWEYCCNENVYRELKKKFKRLIPEIEKIINDKKVINIENCNFKTKPYAHQKEGILFCLEKLL